MADEPSIVDRIDDLWEGADALLRDLRERDDHQEANLALGIVLGSLEVVADAGRRAASRMSAYNLHK